MWSVLSPIHKQPYIKIDHKHTGYAIKVRIFLIFKNQAVFINTLNSWKFSGK